jgi:hypothetical protein
MGEVKFMSKLFGYSTLIGSAVGVIAFKLPIIGALCLGVATGATASLASAGIATAGLAGLAVIGINKVPLMDANAAADNDLSPSEDDIPQKLAVTSKTRLISSVGIGAAAIFAYNAAFNGDDLDMQVTPELNTPTQKQAAQEATASHNTFQNDQGEYVLTAKAPVLKLAA